MTLIQCHKGKNEHKHLPLNIPESIVFVWILILNAYDFKIHSNLRRKG